MSEVRPNEKTIEGFCFDPSSLNDVQRARLDKMIEEAKRTYQGQYGAQLRASHSIASHSGPSRYKRRNIAEFQFCIWQKLYLDELMEAARQAETFKPAYASSITETNGSVYFIECGGFIKIGVTTDLEKRLKSIETSNPHDPTILLSLPGTTQSEKAFHRQFKKQHKVREWFHWEGELADFIFERTGKRPE